MKLKWPTRVVPHVDVRSSSSARQIPQHGCTPWHLAGVNPAVLSLVLRSPKPQTHHVCSFCWWGTYARDCFSLEFHMSFVWTENEDTCNSALSSTLEQLPVHKVFSDNSVTKCKNFCTMQEYGASGTNVNDCYCWQNRKDYLTKTARMIFCSTECPGDTSEKCGGQVTVKYISVTDSQLLGLHAWRQIKSN